MDINHNVAGNPEMPRPSQPGEIDVVLGKLNLLKEPRKAKGCIKDISDYLEWIAGKALFYEKDLSAWNKVQEGGIIRDVHEYVATGKRNIEAYHHEKLTEANNAYASAMARVDHDALLRKAELEQTEEAIRVRKRELAKTQAELQEAHHKAAMEAAGLYNYEQLGETSTKFKERIDRNKARRQQMISNKTAIEFRTGLFSFNGSQKEGDKFVKDFAALMLNAYNQEVENTIIKLDRTKSMATALERIDKAEQKVEKLGTMMSMTINDDYHDLRREEIKIGFAYKEMKAAEKEKEAEQRRLLKEEEKARKEIEKKLQEEEAERKRLEAEIEAYRVALLTKEKTHYDNVLDIVPEEDPVFAEMKARLEDIEESIVRNKETVANTRAGYVYVISNIGAFGEEVVKIGLTRREEPLHRVKELSGASVPFHFDVHALHFAADAVALEHNLHKHFADRAVNRVNPRKEFFRVSPAEVRDAMVELSNGATLEFTEEAIAAEYRQTLELV